LKRKITICLLIAPLFIIFSVNPCYSRIETTPLEFLKEQEKRHKEKKGKVYLGRVITLTYPAYKVDSDEKYHPLLLELTDVLKTPLRKNYQILLKGFSDNSGSAEENRRLSLKRAENLKELLIKKYYMKGKRISFEGHGDAAPVASNKTAEGRKLNRRVEIHISGDVSEAVRFLNKEEEAR